MNSTIRYIKRVLHSPKFSPQALRTEEWNIIRQSVAPDVERKTDGRCFYCGEALRRGWHVEHFLPLAKGGSDEIDNLFPACQSCNTSKGSFSLEEWRMSRRLKIARECFDVPVFSRSCVEWLATKGVDVFDGIPDVAFWFEVEGYETPEGSFSNGKTPAWVTRQAEQRLEHYRQQRIAETIDREAQAQGVSRETILEQVEAA